MSTQEKAEARTPGKLRIGGKNTIADIVDDAGVVIASMHVFVRGHANANARRLVACWNALDGIPTEAIEAGAVQRLVEAAEKVLDDCNAAQPRIELYEALTPFQQKR